MGTHTATPAASKRGAQARNRALTREADAIIRHADTVELRGPFYAIHTAGSMSGRHEAYGTLYVESDAAYFQPSGWRRIRV